MCNLRYKISQPAINKLFSRMGAHKSLPQAPKNYTGNVHELSPITPRSYTGNVYKSSPLPYSAEYNTHLYTIHTPFST